MSAARKASFCAVTARGELACLAASWSHSHVNLQSVLKHTAQSPWVSRPIQPLPTETLRGVLSPSPRRQYTDQLGNEAPPALPKDSGVNRVEGREPRRGLPAIIGTHQQFQPNRWQVATGYCRARTYARLTGQAGLTAYKSVTHNALRPPRTRSLRAPPTRHC